MINVTGARFVLGVVLLSLINAPFISQSRASRTHGARRHDRMAELPRAAYRRIILMEHRETIRWSDPAGGRFCYA